MCSNPTFRVMTRYNYMVHSNRVFISVQSGTDKNMTDCVLTALTFERCTNEALH